MIMIEKRSLIVSALIILCVGLSVEAQDWRGIRPFHSTRSDVERILGKPNAPNGRYVVGNEQAEVFYSKGKCVNGWDVPRDTVIRIAVSFLQSRRFSDLDINLADFEKVRDPFTTNHVYYGNRKEGVRYIVVEDGSKSDGLILAVYYESTTENLKVRCLDTSPQTGTGPCAPTDICPSISIVCEDNCVGPEYKFTVYFTAVCPEHKPSYRWKASGGIITKGQGTNHITVRARGPLNKKLTVNVKVEKAIPRACPSTASFTRKR